MINFRIYFIAIICLTALYDGTNAQDLRLTSPLDYQVIQRFSRDRGLVRIAGTIDNGIPGSVEIRIDSAGYSDEWKRIPATIEGPSFHAAVVLPAGGWYKLNVRVLNGKKPIGQGSVEHIGIGDLFIVAGQSNSANYGEERQVTRTGKVAAYNGSGWQLAADPQPGADGGGGSFMPPFGDAMATKFGVPVGIIACGIGATSVREWLPEGTRFPDPPTITSRVRKRSDGSWESDGRAFNKLVSLFRKLGPEGFRAVLWHQGESDANQRDPSRTLPGYRYWEFMELLIRSSAKEAGWDIPWITAQVSYHVPGDEASPEIRAAQHALWESGMCIEGPDTDALGGLLRENNGQGVHFSAEGLRAHAAAWVGKVSPWLVQQLSMPKYDKALPMQGEIFPVEGRPAFILLPEKISGPVPWVWYAPTLPRLPGTEEKWMFEQFLQAGIAVAGVDAGESYGSPDGNRIFSALYRELTGGRGFSAKPVMLGRSRGGLMTLSWISENPDKTGGFAGIYPVCDLTSYPGLDKACGAFGLTAEQLKVRLAEFNPVEKLAPLASAGVPLFAIHGDRDDLVPLGRNSGEIKRRYDALGGKMKLIVSPGQGHNMWDGFFQSEELVRFVIKNAR